MKNTKTKSIVALAIVLVLTVVFGIVGVTGMPLSGDGLYKLLPWRRRPTLMLGRRPFLWVLTCAAACMWSTAPKPRRQRRELLRPAGRDRFRHPVPSDRQGLCRKHRAGAGHERHPR